MHGLAYARKIKSKIKSQDQDQELVAFKKLRFFQWLSVSKAPRRLCFIHQNSTGDGAYTPLNISLQGMWGCAVSPRKAKAGWTVTRVPPRSHSTLEAPQRPLVTWSRSFDMVGRLHGQACQMTQQRPQGGVRALDCTPRSYGSATFTGRQPVGPVAFPVLSLCWSHGLPSSYGLGHPLNHHTEACGTCYVLWLILDLKTAI